MKHLSFLVPIILFFACAVEEQVEDLQLREDHEVTVVTPEDFYPNFDYFELVEHKGALYVFGNKTLGMGEDEYAPYQVWKSNNGIHWTVVNENIFSEYPTYETAFKVTSYQNSLWLVTLGRFRETNGLHSMNSVWSSPDGLVWTKVIDQIDDPPRSGFEFLVLDTKLTVIGGFSRTRRFIDQNSLLLSEQGNEWEKRSYSVDTGNYDFTDFLSIGNRLLGYNRKIGILELKADNLVSIELQPDGIEQQLFDFDERWKRSDGEFINHNNRLFLMGGFGWPTNTEFYSPDLNDVWASDDGVTWELISEADEIKDEYRDNFKTFPARSNFHVVSWRGVIYLTGGRPDIGSRYRDAWVSPDGVSWYELVRVEE